MRIPTVVYLSGNRFSIPEGGTLDITRCETEDLHVIVRKTQNAAFFIEDRLGQLFITDNHRPVLLEVRPAEY